MPNYKAPRHGVSLSEALHEAAAIAPVQRPMLSTFELYHPVGTPDGPVYVVNDFADLVATKEAGAARDAGASVEFLACYLRDVRPDESDAGGTPQVSLTIGGVSGLMAAALRASRGSLVPWELTERVYAADDTSGPAVNPPMTVYLTAVDLDGETLQITASLGDSINVSVPRLTFNRKDYPGLVP